jgi:hypothetical protein
VKRGEGIGLLDEHEPGVGDRPARGLCRELLVTFDAAALPALSPGWTRTFLLYADGYSNEMNPHSSSPDDLEPLPFHAMSRYPYALPERYPDTPTHRDYRDHYNTRVIGGRLPPLETAR